MIRKPVKKHKPKKEVRSPKKVERKIRPPKPIPQVLNISKDALKVAFIGRSNVGKSSLINFLLNQNIAKTSKHPGKTREHTLFRFSDKISFVDMPGYGYAIIRKERRDQWDKDLLALFFGDERLAHVMVLIDISIPPMKIDQDFTDWLVEHQIPYTVVFTKTDKAKQQEKAKHLNEWKAYLDTLRHPYQLATFEVSVHKKQGGNILKSFINGITLD